MKILIVDDDEGMLNALRELLGAYGHDVVCVSSARDGLDADPNSFDLILLDYKMPVEDGAWFMKNAKVNRKTRVLLITAYVNKDVINKMFSLGVSGYLIKPFDADDLMRHIEFFGSGTGDAFGHGAQVSASL